jgi:hypothetical protein
MALLKFPQAHLLKAEVAAVVLVRLPEGVLEEELVLLLVGQAAQAHHQMRDSIHPAVTCILYHFNTVVTRVG